MHPPCERWATWTRARRLGAAPVVVSALLLVVATLAGAPPASAHPSLVQSAPVAGLVAERAPSAVTLSYTEEVVVRGSKLTLRRLGARPRAVRLGPVTGAGRSGIGARVRERLAPGAYELRYSTLGVDGHVIGGELRFGVPRPDGRPPEGIEQLGTAARAGGPGAAADGEGAPTVLGRWLGLLAAALLLGGTLLRRRLGRLGDGDERWTRVALGALVLGVASAIAGAIAAAAPGNGGGLDVLALTGNGRLALARLVIGLAGAVLALRLGLAARAAGERALAAVGALALLALGLDGHVQALDGGELLALPAAVAHVLAAGVWAGGVLALLVLAAPRRDAEAAAPAALPLADGVRALAPIAGAAVLALAVTGVIAALREVDRSVFLWFTGYGRVVIAKTLLLVALAAIGAAVVRRARRGAAPRAAALRADALGLAGALLLAAALAGLVQGRGQPLPAQRGNLLGGPASATAVAGDTLVRLTVAPARAGVNVVSAVPSAVDGPAERRPASVTVRLRAPGGGREVVARLRRGAGGTWSARVRLPSDGTWFAYPDAAGRRATAPVALAIGAGERFGPAPAEVVQTADLSGAGAARCRAHAQGLALAVGRLNAAGGLDGGDKLLLRTEDDAGLPARAARAVRAARGRGAVALAAPCGAGAGGALRAAGGLPAIVADPDAPVVRAPRVWRLAPDPRTEGVAMGQYIAEQGTTQRPDAPRRVAVVAGRDAAGRARLAGLRSALRDAGVRITLLPARTASDPAALGRAVDLRRWLAAVLDADAATLAPALRRLGEDDPRIVPASIVVRSGLLDERLQERAGLLGRLGVIQAAGEVVVGSRDALVYTSVAEALFRGDRPSIAGLRGYLAGLTLAEGLRDGTDAGAIAGRLRAPRRFTDALTVPWRSDAPADGAPLVGFTAPRFLAGQLIPVQAGGERFQGTWFADGSWQRTTPEVYGPALPGAPAP